jgi:hypothetical protein
VLINVLGGWGVVFFSNAEHTYRSTIEDEWCCKIPAHPSDTHAIGGVVHNLEKLGPVNMSSIRYMGLVITVSYLDLPPLVPLQSAPVRT